MKILPSAVNETTRICFPIIHIPSNSSCAQVYFYQNLQHSNFELNFLISSQDKTLHNTKFEAHSSIISFDSLSTNTQTWTNQFFPRSCAVFWMHVSTSIKSIALQISMLTKTHKYSDTISTVYEKILHIM